MTAPATQATEFVSWHEFLSGDHKTALALVSLAVWLHAADSLIVAPLLPRLIADIGGDAYVPWTRSLYEIGSIIAGASSALVTLKFGLQRPMAVAAALFGLGCAISAFAPTMGIVLTGRLLQGFSGGGMTAMAFIAVGVFFPKRYMARAMACISLIWGTSAFLGPLIGGIFVEVATWRWGFGFFAAQAFALAIWIALARNIPDKPATTQTTSIPALRLLLLSGSVLAIAYAGIFVDPLLTPGLIFLGITLLALFLYADRRSDPARLLPSQPFNLKTTTGAVLVMLFTLTMATIAITAYGPILVIIIHDATALTAGYIVACSSIGWTLAAVTVSGSPERNDHRFIALGVTTIAASILGFLYAVPNGPLWLIALFAGLEGAGFGMAWTFVLRTVTKHTPEAETQRISGAIPTTQRLGYAMGAAVMGIVANAMGFSADITPAQATKIAQTLFLACLPFAAIGLIAMICLLRAANRAPSTTAP